MKPRAAALLLLLLIGACAAGAGASVLMFRVAPDRPELHYGRPGVTPWGAVCETTGPAGRDIDCRRGVQP